MSDHGVPQPLQVKDGPPPTQRHHPVIGMPEVVTKIIVTVSVLLLGLHWQTQGSVIVVEGGVM